MEASWRERQRNLTQHHPTVDESLLAVKAFSQDTYNRHGVFPEMGGDAKS
jgi:hypothetical protein